MRPISGEVVAKKEVVLCGGEPYVYRWPLEECVFQKLTDRPADTPSYIVARTHLKKATVKGTHI